MLEPRIILLTGHRQVGKTTVCEHLVTLLRQADIAISGLITKRTGPHDLLVNELHSGESYPLTTPTTETTGITVGHFRMAPEAIARGDRALDDCFPTQAFILDEIGPLELLRGQGWSRALKLLKRLHYQIAFVVVRPELLVDAMWLLPTTMYTVVQVTVETRDALPAALFNVATDACFATGYTYTSV